MVVLGGIASLFENHDRFTICGKSFNATDALEKIKDSHPDIILTDYSLPDMEGMEFIQKLTIGFPYAKIIVLSMHDELSIVKGILSLGVNGYILKKDDHQEIIKAIDSVSRDINYVSPDLQQLLDKTHEEVEMLTNRELEIVRLIASELTNRQIAQRLSISERTVETHRKNVFRKTGSNNMVGLLKYAYANHII